MKKIVLRILVWFLFLSLLPQSPLPAKAINITEDTIGQMQYDDHWDITGRDVEIVDAGVSADREAVVALKGNFLVATGIGDATVRVDGKVHNVTVSRAKINLIMIMGQSNAGNHFPNATSDVTCPVGTAYWWGNGKGTSAKEPVSYTQPSMGFHTPLLAELYAQSVAAGDPVKNVMIWQEGITSKDGQPIEKWAQSATDTSGTEGAVTMLQNCIAYYKTNSDKYEIVSSGVYWLQGESDITTDPTLYTERFLAMWQRLKDAGMEYLAFFRVRYLNFQSETKEDLIYTPPLSAQIKMINENPDFYMATTITENWTGLPSAVHTVDISRYITMMETYGKESSYSDAYGNHATFADGKLTTTMQCLYGSNNVGHYGKFGYGIIGADAACNMYRALHGQNVKIVVTNTSGYAGCQKVLTNGQQMHLDLTENLTFRAECGSAAGTLSFAAYSGETDITEQVVVPTGSDYGAVNAAKLREYKDISVTVTYTTEKGDIHRVLCYPQGSVETWNLSLQDGLTANFYLQIPDAILSAAQVQLQMGSDTQVFPAGNLAKTEDDFYLASVGIAPAQLNDEISVQVVNGDKTGAKFTCTAHEYLDAILAEPSYGQYHTLAQAMLNYGTAAQIYFDYHTALLTGDDTPHIPKAEIPENAGDVSVTGNAGPIQFYGASLVAGNTLSMCFYFVGDVTGCTFTANGQSCTPVAKDGMHYVEISDIADLEKAILLTVTDASGSTLSVAYSPMNYLVRMYAKGDEKLQNLLNALYNYHLATTAF